MKSNFLLSILILLSFFQCETYESRKENLTKLSRNTILKYHEEDKLTFDKDIVYFNNEVALPSDFELVDSMDYCYDYFIGKSGEIELVEIRQATYQDDITEILKKNIGYDPYEGIPLMDIDCDSLEVVIDDLRRLQPKEIRAMVSLDSMQIDTLDYFDYTKITLVSVEKKCGLSSLVNREKRSANVFWDMVHHNDHKVIAYYFTYFENLVAKGKLHPEALALSTDRILSGYGYNQAYGSQVVNGQLPRVRNKDSVDVRRARIGLEPLSEYLDVYGLEWPAPKKTNP